MGNWFPVGKKGAKKVYADKATCEAEEGQTCFDVTDIVPGDYDVVETPQLDEHGQPVLDDLGQPIVVKELQLNGLRQSERLAAEALEQQIARRIARWGKVLRVIAVIGVRNEAKNLTQQQVEQLVATYQPILLMLLTLSIPTARAMIAAAAVDGVIMTEEDKSAILAEMDA